MVVSQAHANGFRPTIRLIWPVAWSHFATSTDVLPGQSMFGAAKRRHVQPVTFGNYVWPQAKEGGRGLSTHGGAPPPRGRRVIHLVSSV